MKFKKEGGLKTKGYIKDSTHEKPLITIVTVVYNGQEHLEETILSVVNQTYSNIEFIIIDGGSTDNTIDIIHKYEHAIDYWISEKDEGIYDAMNKASELAKGKWINYMNCGDSFCKLTKNSDVAWTTLLASKLNANIIGYGKSGAAHEHAIKTFDSKADYTIFCWTEAHRLYHVKYPLSIASAENDQHKHRIYGAANVYYKYLHNMVNTMPEKCETIEEFLFVANLCIAVQERLYSKLKQLREDEYDWLTPEMVSACVAQFERVVGPFCHTEEWQAEYTIVTQTETKIISTLINLSKMHSKVMRLSIELAHEPI